MQYNSKEVDYKVGITGATGVLGRILQKKLNDNSIDYSVFSKNITIKHDVESWVRENDFDYIFHFAALVPTDLAKNSFDEAKEVNIIGTQYLVSSILDSKKQTIMFYSSSSHVYKSKKTPINENDKINPISKYGETKLSAESEVKKLAHHCIGRIFSFFHHTQEGNFLYPRMKQRIKNDNLESFELYGADSIRDISNAEKIVDIIYELFKKRITGVYNIGSGEGIKIKEFVKSLTDKKIKFIKKGNTDHLVADISKLKKVLKSAR
jgi:nucleoside-diphosphate-sugar epimerase